VKIDRRPLMTFCCAALLMVSSGGNLYAACTDTLQGEGCISAILDARTFRLDDGREVRLIGIELPEETARASSALTSLIDGREITLHGPDDRPDRYGRQPSPPSFSRKVPEFRSSRNCSHAAKRSHQEPSRTRRVPARCSLRRLSHVRQGAAFGPVPLP